MSVGALAVRHDVSSAALVRHSIADDLAGSAIARDSIDDVVLVASELVGNAVLHTPPNASELAVTWEVEPGAVVVCVADPSGDPPVQRDPPPRDKGGRGLAIVAALSTAWGVHCRDGGKQVWARVPVRRG